MQIELEFVQGPFQNRKFSFAEYTKISIGRAPGAYFSFPADHKMSRFHCLMEISPPANCFVKDLGSTNGTFVGREEQGQVRWRQIDDVHLGADDYLKVGASVLRLRLPAEAGESTAPCSRCGKPLARSQYGRGEASMCDGKPMCASCGAGSMDMDGKKFGNFEILHKLGEGGMGKVYLVRHTGNQQQFALKIARPCATPNQAQIDRFLREAACGAKIRHANIVRYYMANYAAAGFFYIPMEYVPGTNFAHYMEQHKQPLALAMARTPILQFLDAVACLHANQIVHRDIKPSNLLLQEHNGQLSVKLSDFGLAKNYMDAGLSGITLSNQMIGTPEYVAPEQLQNSRDVDPRADIYSAAATIYFLLTGRGIYDDSPAHMVTKILLQEVRPIRDINPLVPEPLAQAIMHCLRKEAKDRPATIDDLRRAVSSA